MQSRRTDQVQPAAWLRRQTRWPIAPPGALHKTSSLPASQVLYLHLKGPPGEDKEPQPVQALIQCHLLCKTKLGSASVLGVETAVFAGQNKRNGLCFDE